MTNNNYYVLLIKGQYKYYCTSERNCLRHGHHENKLSFFFLVNALNSQFSLTNYLLDGLYIYYNTHLEYLPNNFLEKN